MASNSLDLGKEEACIRGTLSAVAYGAIWLDARGMVIFLNPAAEILLCRRSEEAFGLDLDSLLGKAPDGRLDIDAAACPVLLSVLRGSDYYRESERAVAGDGRVLCVSLSARALLLRGAFRGVIILVREVVPSRVAAGRHPVRLP